MRPVSIAIIPARSARNPMPAKNWLPRWPAPSSVHPGIVPSVRHADYIGSWLEVLREDNRAIVRAASAASKAADHILGFQSVTQQRAETSHATDDQEAG